MNDDGTFSKIIINIKKTGRKDLIQLLLKTNASKINQMKSSIQALTILLTLLVSCTGRAQMVKSVDEIDKLDSNKSYFIGKSIKHLLSEIKPEIKMAKFVPKGSASNRSTITFFFIQVDKFKQYEKTHKQPPSYIRVTIKEEEFEFNWNGLEWTPEMARKYGSYIVHGIRVFKGEK
ncbi:hypothetical protein GCM10027566_33020 [Arachidicoccus ginsenosidivorans]|uniref:Uncharacterized protein n=1 Tax=Arachidicoccus ginsenosidivorans TaxID=496057 RepID=A0A5B8VKM3_9BACT|nr:hypothetical protein [Arachidicoccus ginsenosidivorans]QEC71515.1 hypothetical protein FSB73_07370 [Arachidicoccus ginsenosidivorans]